jgi:hypothetical protein
MAWPHGCLRQARASLHSELRRAGGLRSQAVERTRETEAMRASLEAEMESLERLNEQSKLLEEKLKIAEEQVRAGPRPAVKTTRAAPVTVAVRFPRPCAGASWHADDYMVGVPCEDRDGCARGCASTPVRPFGAFVCFCLLQAEHERASARDALDQVWLTACVYVYVSTLLVCAVFDSEIRQRGCAFGDCALFAGAAV